MSRRLQMLQVARLARRSLGESADLVTAFLRSRAVPGGGFGNRDGVADLYYTPFALDALVALDDRPAVPTPRAPAGTVAATSTIDPAHAAATRDWLVTFGGGGPLDFVHRCCLARAWAAWPHDACPADIRAPLLAGILAHEAAGGGFATRPGAERGTAYGCFLAVNALADLGAPIAPDDERAARIAACLATLRSADGGWANDPGRPLGATPATAAAVATLASLARPLPHDAAAWLLARRHESGGFLAAPDAPLPDLLSTAVALHALDLLEAPWRAHRDAVLDFLDTLWTAAGAFHGSWADDEPDAEYTFYGLVALGHAAV
jgi:prenyltransferase beta subunit